MVSTRLPFDCTRRELLVSRLAYYQLEAVMGALESRHFVRPREPATGGGFVRLAVVLTATVIWPVSANAQTTAAQAIRSNPWDVSGVVGVLAGHPETANVDRYGDNWYDTAQAGLIWGRYLTAHVKGEIELSTSGEGRQYLYSLITIPGYPYPAPYRADRFSRLRQVSGSLVWQFFDNQWVHPFLQAGVAADFERVRTYTPAQSIVVGDPRSAGSRVEIIAERTDGPHTTTTARLFLGGGAKMYVTEQLFFRADGRVAGNGKSHHTAVRIGLGLDF